MTYQITTRPYDLKQTPFTRLTAVRHKQHGKGLRYLYHT